MNHGLGYARYELLRTFRNRRLFIFSLGFLTAFGTMNAVLGSGARIAAERAVGWNRQLRLTPLSTRTYFRVKVLTAYCTAAFTIALLYAAGVMLGVHLQAGNWVRMTGLILVGLAPFAALGILLGHLLTTDSVGPAIGGTTAVSRCWEASGFRSRAA